MEFDKGYASPYFVTDSDKMIAEMSKKDKNDLMKEEKLDEKGLKKYFEKKALKLFPERPLDQFYV